MAVGFMATGSGLANLGLAVAAGALNATRPGLGTGTRTEAERLSHHLDARLLAGAGPPHARFSL